LTAKKEKRDRPPFSYARDKKTEGEVAAKKNERKKCRKRRPFHEENRRGIIQASGKRLDQSRGEEG